MAADVVRFPEAQRDTRTVAGLAAVYEHNGCHHDREGVKTWDGYKTALKHFGALRLGPGRWEQRGGLPRSAERGDVMKLLRELRDLRGLAPATCNTVRASVMAVAWRAGVIAHDLHLYESIAGADKFKLAPKARRDAPPELLMRVLAELSEPEQCFAELVWFHGLRPGEVRGLLSDDVRFREQMLVVRRSGPKALDRKNVLPRPIQVQDETWRKLLYVLEHRDAVRPKFGKKNADALRFVFPWAAQYLAGMVERIRAAAGADADTFFPQGTCLYAGRHTLATTVGETEGNLLAIQQAIGDRTDTAATNYYAGTRRGTESQAAVLARARSKIEGARAEQPPLLETREQHKPMPAFTVGGTSRPWTLDDDGEPMPVSLREELRDADALNEAGRVTDVDPLDWYR